MKKIKINLLDPDSIYQADKQINKQYARGLRIYKAKTNKHKATIFLKKPNKPLNTQKNFKADIHAKNLLKNINQ